VGYAVQERVVERLIKKAAAMRPAAKWPAPINSRVGLANTLCDQGKALKGGDLVSTGVCMDIYHAEPGDSIVADFGCWGTVEAAFF